VIGPLVSVVTLPLPSRSVSTTPLATSNYIRKLPAGVTPVVVSYTNLKNKIEYFCKVVTNGDWGIVGYSFIRGCGESAK
jgi:hypothetical protein